MATRALLLMASRWAATARGSGVQVPRQVRRHRADSAAAAPCAQASASHRSHAASARRPCGSSREADRIVPSANRAMMVEAMKATGGNVRYSEYAGVGHNVWLNAAAESELLPWLLKQRR